MTGENLLHIKLEYGEKLKGKGDILYIESSLLKMVKSMRNFHEIRKKEFMLKQVLAKRIKDSLLFMKEIKTVLPKEAIIPRKLKEESFEIPEISFDEEKISDEEMNLEDQLREINERLKLLE